MENEHSFQANGTMLLLAMHQKGSEVINNLGYLENLLILKMGNKENLVSISNSFKCLQNYKVPPIIEEENNNEDMDYRLNQIVRQDMQVVELKLWMDLEQFKLAPVGEKKLLGLSCGKGYDLIGLVKNWQQ